MSAATIAEKLRSRELGAVEVTQHFLDELSRKDPQIQSFLAVNAEGALTQAKEAQRKLDAKTGSSLTGVPIAIKDNISTDGLETTCASKILKGYIPPYDGTVVTKLKEAGLPILGKTNLDEFAMGTSCELSAFHPTRNPWDLDRSPGGSSGGSAASVAAGIVPLSLGSDTGGSIRQPASLCGIAGFKPTYGRVSRYGLIAFGSSLDQIGPFARSVKDIALLSEIISGHDPLDSTSDRKHPISVPNIDAATVKGKRFGIPKELVAEGIADGVMAVFNEFLDKLKAAGAEIVPISIPSVKLGVSTYYIIAPAEASSNLARFDGIRFGPRAEAAGGHIGVVERTRGELFGHEVKARIMIGTYALSAGYYDAFYLKAQTVRAMMTQEFLNAFHGVDFIISPTSPVPAFKIGELIGDPLAMKILDLCTIPANLAGMPGISVNAGFTDGLPVGVQLMAAPMEDEALLAGAYAVEQLLGGAQKLPPQFSAAS